MTYGSAAANAASLKYVASLRACTGRAAADVAAMSTASRPATTTSSDAVRTATSTLDPHQLRVLYLRDARYPCEGIIQTRGRARRDDRAGVGTGPSGCWVLAPELLEDRSGVGIAAENELSHHACIEPRRFGFLKERLERPR